MSGRNRPEYTVGEGLVYFQGKVAQIVEAIGFSFNDLYFVIDPFQLSSVNGEIAVIQNAIAISLQHLGKSVE